MRLVVYVVVQHMIRNIIFPLVPGSNIPRKDPSRSYDVIVAATASSSITVIRRLVVITPAIALLAEDVTAEAIV